MPGLRAGLPQGGPEGIAAMSALRLDLKACTLRPNWGAVSFFSGRNRVMALPLLNLWRKI